MKDENKIRESIKFVASNYDDVSFSTSRAWRKIMPPVAFRNFKRIAAASAIAIVLTASAFIYHATRQEMTTKDIPETIQEPTAVPVKNKDFCTRIEFNNAPLKDVIAKIEEVYQVRISNVPEKDIHLTLSYEGTAEELIDVINEITGAELKIER